MNKELVELMKKYKAKPNETIYEHTENLVKCAKKLYELKYISKESFIDLEKACTRHDIGKINPFFQDRILANINGKRIKFDKNNEAPHNVLSFFLLDNEILEEYESNYSVFYAIINHHKRIDNFEYIGKAKNIIKKNLEKIHEIYSTEYDYDDYLIILDEIDDLISENRSEADVLLGLLNKCDYAASAGIEIEFAPDFLNKAMDTMMIEWQKNNLDAKWNGMQEYCFENQNKNLIVIAATGSGKTEAALRWIGNNKGFFVLPMKTAINAIYSRIEQVILKKEKINERLGLLHGDTLDIYMINNREGLVGNEEALIEKDQIINYLDRTKMYSLPLNISTPDQLFTFIFKPKGYELKYAMLSYSKIVIDEIQAYSADILASIIFAIHKIIEIGGKVSIFTATLPPYVEKFLNSEVKNNKIESKNCFEKFVDKSSLDEKDKIRHSIAVFEKELRAEEIIKHYDTNKSEYKKYLVVCNTVKKAQEIYLELKEKGFENIFLLHSKFIKKDRNLKENRILKDGKTFDIKGNIDKSDLIWISTQIVEASLDIDFDYLFTELSDLNSLFQRMGRINRKGKKEVDKENCFIYTDINKHLLHVKDSKMGFIDKGIYELSKEAVINFSKNKNLITEKDKYDLINNYLTFEKLENKDSAFIKEYIDNYNRFQTLNTYDISSNDKFRNIISFDAIPVDIDNGIINEVEIKELEQEYKELDKKDPNYFIKYNEIRRKLKLLTVSVGLYDKKEGEGINSSKNIEKFKLIENNNILYLYCKYDSELGYIRINKDNREDKVEDSDIFI